VRYGLAHRHRWVGALQLSRLDPGRGFRPAELDFLDRAAPALARALAALLAPATPAADRPPAGHVTFDADRRLVSMSASGERWLARLAPDALAPAVPVAVQSLVGHLAGTSVDAGAVSALTADGEEVRLSAEPALRLAPDGTPGRGWSVTIGSAPVSARGLTGAQWSVAQAVARGDSDREIAAALHLSPATVHEHVAALHALLGTGTRPRLVAVLAGSLT
jgi:DNA-binding CsgD family transcriptional regulator